MQVLNGLIHKVVYIPLRADYACSVAESAIRSKRLRQGCTDASTFCIFAPDKTYYKPKDNGAGRFTILANNTLFPVKMWRIESFKNRQACLHRYSWRETIPVWFSCKIFWMPFGSWHMDSRRNEPTDAMGAVEYSWCSSSFCWYRWCSRIRHHKNRPSWGCHGKNDLSIDSSLSPPDIGIQDKPWQNQGWWSKGLDTYPTTKQNRMSTFWNYNRNHKW